MAVLDDMGREVHTGSTLKVHKNENFFEFDFEFCTISLLVYVLIAPGRKPWTV